MKTKTNSKLFTLKIWRRECFRKISSDVAPNRPAFVIFSNKPSFVQREDFKRLLGSVAPFERLHGNPLPHVEAAIKAGRLADACRALKKEGLIQGV